MIGASIQRLLFALLACSCAKNEPPLPTEAVKIAPEHIDTKIGTIEVTDTIPASAEFMCSADLEVYPRAEIHVVPTYESTLGRYVGSYRCNEHWKAAIAETRARFSRTPTADEGAKILQVFVERGVTTDQLRPLTGGRPIEEAVPAVLDALAAGALIIAP